MVVDILVDPMGVTRTMLSLKVSTAPMASMACSAHLDGVSLSGSRALRCLFIGLFPSGCHTLKRSKVIPENEGSTTNKATVTILESTLYSLTDVEIPVTTQCNRPLYRKKK
jgi:hypothetical protein